MRKSLFLLFATLSLLFLFTSCDGDCVHEWSEWSVTAAGDCTNDGSRTRKCIACGEVQTEVILGEHQYGEWIEEKGKTCTENGEMGHYHCELCGKNFDGEYSELDNLVIPMGHSFEDGICVICGEKSDCTHENLKFTSIDLKTYGVCGGTLSYLSCDCGSIKKLDPVFSEIYLERATEECHFYVDPPADGISQDDNENENESSDYYEVCHDCGLCVSYTDTSYTMQGCSYMCRGNVSFKRGDTVIVGGIAIEYTEEHAWTYDYIRLTPEDIGACTASAPNLDNILGGDNSINIFNGWYATYCTECEKYICLEDMHISLNEEKQGDFIFGFCDDTNKTVQTGTDEQGRRFYKASLDCADCGISYVLEEYLLSPHKDCVYLYTQDCIIKRGDEIVVETHFSYPLYEHNYGEVTYTLAGEDCSDGGTKRYACLNCRDEFVDTFYGHSYQEYTIDLSKYNLCGGHITAEYCDICGHIFSHNNTGGPDNLIDFNVYCELKTTVDEREVDGVLHKITTLFCADCGLRIEYDEWNVEISVCLTKHIQQVKIYANEILIFNGHGYYETDSHNWQYTDVSILGETCEDGWRATRYCTECNERDAKLDFGHNYETTSIDISQYGVCCNQIEKINVCQICQSSDFSIDDILCECKMILSNKDDEDNVIDGLEIYTCENCGIVKRVQTVETTEGCVTTVYETVTLCDASGNELLKEEDSWERYNHDYEYTYERVGDTCDEGYWSYGACKYCDNTTEHFAEGHREIWDTFEYEFDDFCAIIIKISECDFCHQVVDVYDSSVMLWDVITSEENIRVEQCSATGVIRTTVIEYGEKDESCRCIKTRRCTYTLDGQVLYGYELSTEVTNHDIEKSYVMVGVSCSDGYYVTQRCKDCEYYYNRHDFGHYETVEKQKYSLSDYGMTEGEIVIKGCLCGEYTYDELEGDYSWEDFVEIDALGTALNIYRFPNDFIVATGVVTDTDGVRYNAIYIDLNTDTGEYAELIKYGVAQNQDLGDVTTPEVPIPDIAIPDEY